MSHKMFLSSLLKTVLLLSCVISNNKVPWNAVHPHITVCCPEQVFCTQSLEPTSWWQPGVKATATVESPKLTFVMLCRSTSHMWLCCFVTLWILPKKKKGIFPWRRNANYCYSTANPFLTMNKQRPYEPWAFLQCLNCTFIIYNVFNLLNMFRKCEYLQHFDWAYCWSVYFKEQWFTSLLSVMWNNCGVTAEQHLQRR